jgi:predicted NUDIX family NTP pyrophosphohydrolase
VPKRSAGLLVWRRSPDGLEVLLVHPGGPLWARKDDGAWSVPKGEIDVADEEPIGVAMREFREELGTEPPSGDPVPLGEVRQSSGKVVSAWALEGDLDVTTIESNTFEMEWPPRSGTRRSFPEVDRAGWFGLDEARVKLLASQVPFLDRLGPAIENVGGG